MLAPNGRTRLEVQQDFPGFSKAPDFICDLIDRTSARSVVDIGGGANPVLAEHVGRLSLDYTVIDISRDELDKGIGSHRRLCLDIAAPWDEFRQGAGNLSADLVFSHMVFEHLKDPAQAHRNIHSILKPGGLSVHLFPSPNNLPLMVNHLLPETLTHALVRLFQPERDISGRRVKFPTYYKLCGAPSAHLSRMFESMGFEVVEHTGYVGHSYYEHVPVVKQIELAMRRPLARAGIPLISDVVLILRKV